MPTTGCHTEDVSERVYTLMLYDVQINVLVATREAVIVHSYICIMP